MSMARLVDLAAERIGVNVYYDTELLSGSVTLRLEDPLGDEELWQVTQTLLASRGLAVVQRSMGADPEPPLMSIVRLNEAAGAAVPAPEVGAVVPPGYASVVIEASHRTPAALLKAVEPLLSKPGGSVLQIGDSNLLLISDLRPRLDFITQMLQRLDAPARSPVVEVIEAVHLEATLLASLTTAAAKARDALTERPLRGKLLPTPDEASVVVIAPPDELGTWRELIAQFDQRAEIITRSYTPRHFGLDAVAQAIEQQARDASPRGAGEQWRVVSDPLTGSVIVTATPAEHETITALLDRLNAMPVDARRPVRAFPIRNRSVVEIRELLAELVEAGALAGDVAQLDEIPPAAARPDLQETRREVLPPAATPALPSGQAPAAVERPRGRTEGDATEEPTLTLTADEGTNTLIVVGEPKRLEQIEALLVILDVRQPQVMLEVLVLNLTEADTLDLGVELQKLEVSGDTLIRLSSVFGLSELTPFDADVPAAGGSGFSGVVLNPGDFSVVLRALRTLNQGRTLNVPKVLVNNNEQAVLDSVLQEPFVSTNASDTIATTSFGGTLDAGTSVAIRPQIAEGDHLVLEYEVALSNFVGESADPTIPPPRQQNTLASVVTVPDGFTVVLGGLETTNEAQAISQVPLLGSIPLLGEAFKSRSLTNSRSRFYVFIRPAILREPGFADLKYISGEDMATMDIDDGWPVVEPRIIR